MEQIRTAHEISADDIQQDTRDDSFRPASKELRALHDLELLWVGGGDGAVGWP